jgi:hypothetical protein
MSNKRITVDVIYPRVHLGWGYYIETSGKVWSDRSNKYLKAGIGTNGRPLVRIFTGDRYQTKYIHVLVCTAFKGPRPENCVVSHLDGNALNNDWENLVWETQLENIARKNTHGTHDRGTNNSRASMTDSDVRELRKDYAEGAYASHTEAAKYYRVSRTTISRILNGLRYQEVV